MKITEYEWKKLNDRINLLEKRVRALENIHPCDMERPIGNISVYDNTVVRPRKHNIHTSKFGDISFNEFASFLLDRKPIERQCSKRVVYTYEDGEIKSEHKDGENGY